MDDTGSQQATPLVHDGVMYLPNPRGVIQALDAATGDSDLGIPAGRGAGAGGARGPRRRRADRHSPTRAAAGARAATPGAASSATSPSSATRSSARPTTRTSSRWTRAPGKLVWDVTVADEKLGYEYTSGPIVVRGKVIAGMTGCSRYKDDVCFITGHDAETGKELWRTSTIARPGEPGGDTWGDLPLQFRAGSDAWIPGSYDPAANLVYWGTAQAKPWARAVRGTDGAALYTNSTLALDPDTGKMQLVLPAHPRRDARHGRGVREHPRRRRRAASRCSRWASSAILWQLDRKTGAFIRATDLGYQNILDVDPQTGKVTYRPGKIPQVGKRARLLPEHRRLQELARDGVQPADERALHPDEPELRDRHVRARPRRTLGGGGTGPVRRKNTKHPKSDGNLGEFLALDVRIGQGAVAHRTPSPSNTAALATAGGVVFGGDWDRHMYAYDAATGKVLWQTRLPTSAQGFPITYLAGGKQYVAMPAGIGGGSWSTLIAPELAPEIRRPNSGNVLLVFALPGPARCHERLAVRCSSVAALVGAAAQEPRAPSGTASTPRLRPSGAAWRTRSPARPATPTTCAAGAPPRAWSRRASRSCGRTCRSATSSSGPARGCPRIGRVAFREPPTPISWRSLRRRTVTRPAQRSSPTISRS